MKRNEEKLMHSNRFRQASRLALAALALCALHPADAQLNLRYTDLAVPGTSGNSSGTSISATGNSYSIVHSDPSVNQSTTYIVSSGVPAVFNAPRISPSGYPYVAAVNDTGIATGYVVSDYGIWQGYFLYSGGTFSSPIPADGILPRYTGITADGKVSMSYLDTTGLRCGAIYDTATQTFADIPNVVPGRDTNATAIASNGTVLGHYRDANDVLHGYTYLNGTFTLLPDVPGAENDHGESDIEFTGINANGLISGKYYNDDGIGSFLYDGSAYTFLHYPGAAGTTVGWGLSDTNELVGTYFLPNGDFGAYRLSVVPEPNTIVLFFGMAGAGLILCRKSRKH